MYEDKTLICKECGKEFVFTAGEQEFYAEKGFVNEPRDARLAAMQERTLLKAIDRCTQQLVHAVAARQRFLSSPKMIVLFIVASALQR